MSRVSSLPSLPGISHIYVKSIFTSFSAWHLPHICQEYLHFPFCLTSPNGTKAHQPTHIKLPVDLFKTVGFCWGGCILDEVDGLIYICPDEEKKTTLETDLVCIYSDI
ncbi:hypothetical protein BsWGS_03864 [Bradybaena similaris]